MDKIILIDKEKCYTSRDIVNMVSKSLNIKKVGHFGTLDPLATGLLVLGTNNYTKIVNLFENDTKEYIAEVLVGIQTDTYDLEGSIIKQKDVKDLDEKILKEVLSSFKGKYNQEVPIYSAVKVKGKKLYEYAREQKEVILPKKEVEIFEIELLKIKKDKDIRFTFKTKVSKGTYIRSLINDIGNKLNIPLCMSALKRTKQDNITLDKANKVEEIKNKTLKLYDLEDFFDIKKEEINEENEKYILNGNVINRSNDLILFTKNNKNIALYKKYNDNSMKPFIIFK